MSFAWLGRVGYDLDMLTEGQERYLKTIPQTAKAEVKPWDSKAAGVAKRLIEDIEKAVPELEVFWSGVLALGISGQNDIDLSILSSSRDFEKHLPKLIPILGEPQKKSDKNILWRIVMDGYRLDAYLSDKNSGDIKLHKQIFGLLKGDPRLLEEYKNLKENANGSPLREYQRRKYEFYNRILNPREHEI